MGSEMQPPELSPVGNERLCSQPGAEDQDRTGVTGGYEGHRSCPPQLWRPQAQMLQVVTQCPVKATVTPKKEYRI